VSVLVLAAQVWLGSMFVYSGVLKLSRYESIPAAVAAYGLIEPRLAGVLGLVLPWLELATGALLLGTISAGPGSVRIAGAAIATTLGAVFATAAGSVIVRGKGGSVPCGCTGRPENGVTGLTLARALTITLTSAVVVAQSHSAASLPWFLVVAVAVLAATPGLGTLFSRRTQQAATARPLSVNIPAVD
jgi:hypothetical protein